MTTKWRDNVKDVTKAEKHLIHAYNRNMTFVSGHDVYLVDDDGQEYLDFAAGIAVSALGYSNETYKNALKDQVDTLIHTSNLYFNQPSIEASQKFAKASGMDKVFFTNSGAEAVEGAIKLARKYAYAKNPECGGHIVAMEHSFHGRTMGALSVTGTEKYRTPFEPLIGGVSFAEYNNLDSVKEKVTEDTCAVIMEVVQGEGGIYTPEKEFLEGVRTLCDERDICLIFDEIQCGMGRTGSMFAYQQFGVKPHILTSAKALGCGVPVGVFAAVDKVATALVPGDHGTTYGGNPLATRAVSTVFDIFEQENLLAHVQEMGTYLWEQLETIQTEFDVVKEHRGIGLMQGLEFSVPAADIVKKVLAQHVILISAGTNVIRFVPPLVIEKEHIDTMCSALRKALA